MSDGQFQLVYNILSFSLASMMATTLFLWMKVPFIAAYHYFRIFNSWTEAYSYTLDYPNPQLTGVPFNDAYRYMDWLLTVPMLLMEIVLVMKLSSEEASQKCISLGLSSALMIILGYPGELIVEGDLSQRWMYWMLAMLPFCYVVYELLVGLTAATASETDPRVRDLVFRAQWVTVVSWLTYPVVYIFPMLGFKGAQAVVNIQVGYCVSDVISKCGVGLIIYSITAAKSAAEKQEQLLPSRR